MYETELIFKASTLILYLTLVFKNKNLISIYPQTSKEILFLTGAKKQEIKT